MKRIKNNNRTRNTHTNAEINHETNERNTCQTKNTHTNTKRNHEAHEKQRPNKKTRTQAQKGTMKQLKKDEKTTNKQKARTQTEK